MKISGCTNNLSNYHHNLSNTKIHSDSTYSVKKSTGVKDDVSVRSFGENLVKIKEEDTLSVERINALRDELKNRPVTSEVLATAMIDYVKNNSWQTRG